VQVSPVEIENMLLTQPDKLIVDVSVVGVSGGRTSDERVPRSWIMLSPADMTLGEKEVMARLDAWVQERLSRTPFSHIVLHNLLIGHVHWPAKPGVQDTGRPMQVLCGPAMQNLAGRCPRVKMISLQLLCRPMPQTKNDIYHISAQNLSGQRPIMKIYLLLMTDV
jgi:hypothetical protein